MNENAILQGIQIAEERDWHSFFEIFRQQQYQQIRSAQTDEDRLKIQCNIKGFDFVEETFKRVRLAKKIS